MAKKKRMIHDFYRMKQDGEKIDKKLAHAQILDPVMQDIDALNERLDAIEKRLGS